MGRVVDLKLRTLSMREKMAMADRIGEDIAHLLNLRDYNVIDIFGYGDEEDNASALGGWVYNRLHETVPGTEAERADELVVVAREILNQHFGRDDF